MSSRPQINFVVSEDQRTRWEEFIEESTEFSSKSELIRRSVEERIHGDAPSSSDAAVPDALADQLPELLEGMQRLEKRLSDIENRIGAIEHAVTERPDVKALANRVFEVLPTKNELEEYREQGRGSEPPWVDPGPVVSGQVEHIAWRLEVEPFQVDEAIEQLVQDTHLVHQQERDDQVLYYKEE